MVVTPVVVLTAVVTCLTAYLWWLYHIIQPSMLSGDTWYMRQFAFTDHPVSAPYCWRPLLPILSRWFGFAPVSVMANAITPFVIYGYAGGGWKGFLCAAIFLMNPHIFQFNIKNPEYTEGVGHLLIVSTVWALMAGHWLVFPLALMCALTRETITAAVGAVAVFVNPWVLIPLVVGTLAARFVRKEDKTNRHPLVEDTYYGTIARWAKHKGWKAFHCAHTILPLRGAPFAVPFVWGGVGADARLGLWGLLPIWLLALPASGQSRIVCYGFVFFVPFLSALPVEWLAAVTILSAFWPIDWRAYDEEGDAKFTFVGRAPV